MNAVFIIKNFIIPVLSYIVLIIEAALSGAHKAQDGLSFFGRALAVYKDVKEVIALLPLAAVAMLVFLTSSVLTGLLSRDFTLRKETVEHWRTQRRKLISILVYPTVVAIILASAIIGRAIERNVECSEFGEWLSFACMTATRWVPFLGGVAAMYTAGWIRWINDYLDAKEYLISREFREAVESLLPDSRVRNWVKDHSEELETLIDWQIVQCFDANRQPVSTPTVSEIKKTMWKLLFKRYDLNRSITLVLKQLKELDLAVTFRFNPMKRRTIFEDATRPTFTRAARLTFNLFKLKEEVEFVPRMPFDKVIGARRDVRRPVAETDNEGNTTVRLEQCSIGDLIPSVTTARAGRIANGMNVYFNCLFEANCIFGAEGLKECASYETDYADLEMAGIAMNAVDPKNAVACRDWIARSLEGNALSSVAISKLVAGTYRAAAVAHAEQMASVLSTGKGHEGMSRTFVEKALEARGFSSVLKKYVDAAKEQNMFDLSMSLIRKASVERRIKLGSKFGKFVIAGTVLTSLGLALLPLANRPNPASRTPKYFTPKAQKNKVSTKYYLPATGQNQSLSFLFYDRNDPANANASFVGRLAKDNGLGEEESLEYLARATKYLIKKLNPPTLDYSEVVPTPENRAKWINGRAAWSGQKRQQHLEVSAEMPYDIDRQYLYDHSAMEAFIKDEYYSVSSLNEFKTEDPFSWKFDRNICDRPKEFKIVAGTVLQPVNDWLFHQKLDETGEATVEGHEFVVKHIPHPQRGTYLDARYAGAGKVMVTDHSAFESSATAVAQHLVEGMFYRTMLPRDLWFVHDAICQPNIVRNKASGAAAILDVKRFSGDITTSVGNTLLNLTSVYAAHAMTGGMQLPELDEIEKAFVRNVRVSFGAQSGRPLKPLSDPLIEDIPGFEHFYRNLRQTDITGIVDNLTVTVEGDDGIVASPKLAEAKAYQKAMVSMGMNVKIMEAEHVSKAGFCSLYWNRTPTGIKTYTDPLANIINAMWSTTPPTKNMTADDLFKAKLRSVCQLFPNCPVVWKLAQESKFAVVPDTAYRRQLFEKLGYNYKVHGPYLKVEMVSIAEPSREDRVMFHELYGLSPEAQMEFEEHGIDGLYELIQFCTCDPKGLTQCKLSDMREYVRTHMANTL